MEKYLLILPLLFAMPSTAIAESIAALNQLPANYMIWRGKIYNLDYMAGKGASPVTQPQIKPVAIDTKETRANKQRVNYENAKSQIMIERLQNMR